MISYTSTNYNSGDSPLRHSVGDFSTSYGYHHLVERNPLTKSQHMFQFGQSNGIVTMYTVSKLSSSLSAGK